jgi:hypothetical protein
VGDLLIDTLVLSTHRIHCHNIQWNLSYVTFQRIIEIGSHKHWGKADDRNCNYGHPKMVDVESGKNLFCRLNCFYNVF